MTSHIKIKNIPPRIQYIANGENRVFDFPFAIFDADNLKVFFEDKLQSSDSYTISDMDTSNGGTVTFTNAPSNGTLITFFRQIDIQRTSDFQEGATLRADALNHEFDYQIACQQQIADDLNRSLVLPPYATDANVDLTLPFPEAGKSLVWSDNGKYLENSTISVNSLEKDLNEYKNEAQNAAEIASQKATEAYNAANRLNGFYTNCVTRTPQDIKLELKDGSVILKKGSKVYFPEGKDENNNNLFSSIITPSDVSRQITGDGEYMLSIISNASVIAHTQTNNCFSSESAPSNYGLWYDLAQNKIKNPAGDKRSFPFAVVTVQNGGIKKIKHIFNGIGFIGSCLFILPEIEAVIPNGRNEDGTSNNNTIKVTEPIIFSVNTDLTTKTNIRLSNNHINIGILCYDKESNLNKNLSDGTVLCCNVGDVKITSGRINEISTKTVFQSFDLNDFKIAIDANNATNISSGHVADKTEWVTISMNGAENKTNTIYINNVSIATSSGSQNPLNVQVIISAGDVVTWSGTSSVIAKAFMFKGV